MGSIDFDTSLDFIRDESSAITSKSLALIDRISSSVSMLDEVKFPTNSSCVARDRLLGSLASLGLPANLEPVDPAVLYSRLISMQRLADVVASSASDRIAWPLVRFCDEIWQNIFHDEGPDIFYGLLPEHNYSIVNFDDWLSSILRDVLPKAEIESIVGARGLYCLRLAQIEDENSPLYATIGHEFGHALFDREHSKLIEILDEESHSLRANFKQKLEDIDKLQASRRMKRILAVFVSLAQELFCDAVGVRLMGPAFLLSLFEISWGQNKNAWSVSLEPGYRYTNAYPSFAFRLGSLQKSPAVKDFVRDAEREFDFPSDPAAGDFKRLVSCLTSIPADHSGDKVIVRPGAEQDAAAINSVLADDLGRIKDLMSRFLMKADGLILNWVPGPDILSGHEVAALLLRLKHHVLPNIVPDDTLLGQPASFVNMLNASAIYRIYILASGDQGNRREYSRESAIAERLTAKALEVSFIQREFMAWKEVSDVGT